MHNNVENNQDINSSSASAFAFSFFLFFVLFAAGAAADLWTKDAAFQALGMPGEYRRIEQPELESAYYLWNGVFGFQTSLNTGALFGLGQGQVHILAVLSFVFLAGIICYVLLFAWKSRFLTVILAFISAGIFGNLYDRLAFHGITDVDGNTISAVRDWILVLFGSYRYPNFNIADSMLVCSAVLLVVYSLWFDKRV
ncbi:MAG: signal peptidase II [Planctomycetaceae bacterium]|jgi:signal peptidase II|nr:signal peptidase II [Planctomycetaceae bacterium]